MFDLFRVHVPNFWYLETRGWFVRNPALQTKLERLVNQGQGHLVQVACGDFEEHIDSLLLGCQEQEHKDEEQNTRLTMSQ